MWARSPSRTFLIGLMGFIVGVGIHSFFDPYRHWWPQGLAGAGLALFAALLFWFHRSLARIILLGFFMMLSGIARFDAAIPYGTADEIGFYAGKQVLVHGVVRTESAERVSRVEYEIATSQPGYGRVLVRTPLTTRWRYGDKLRLRCKLERPPEFPDFDYARFLARRGIFVLCSNPQAIEVVAHDQGNVMMGKLLGVKSRFVSRLRETLPEPQSGLASGILLGDRALSSELSNDFRITGVSHIVAASGYNIGIVTNAMLLALLRIKFMNRRRAFAVLVLGIIAYALLAGGGSAVVRAAVMGLLVLLAAHLGRPSRMINVMVFAGAVMLAANPRLLAFDIGFLLSFAATCGIVFVSPKLRARYRKIFPDSGFWRASSRLLFDTISAIVLTLPIILWEFGTLSLVALPANLLIVFVVPFAMLVSFGLGVVALVFLPIAHLLVYAAWIPLTYMIDVAHLFASIPFASVQTGDWSRALAVVSTLGAIWFVRRLQKPAPKSLEPVEPTGWQIETV